MFDHTKTYTCCLGKHKKIDSRHTNCKKQNSESARKSVEWLLAQLAAREGDAAGDGAQLPRYLLRYDPAAAMVMLQSDASVSKGDCGSAGAAAGQFTGATADVCSGSGSSRRGGQWQRGCYASTEARGQ